MIGDRHDERVEIYEHRRTLFASPRPRCCACRKIGGQEGRAGRAITAALSDNGAERGLRVIALGIGKLVFSINGAVYENADSDPIPESAPRLAVNPYDKLKLMIEDIRSRDDH